MGEMDQIIVTGGGRFEIGTMGAVEFFPPLESTLFLKPDGLPTRSTGDER